MFVSRNRKCHRLDNVSKWVVSYLYLDTVKERKQSSDLLPDRRKQVICQHCHFSRVLTSEVKQGKLSDDHVNRRTLKSIVKKY